MELDFAASEALALVRRTFPHYTEHGRQHYLNLILRMGQFMPPNLIKKLSAVEHFLLMASAMLHDIGMVVAEEELLNIDSDKDYRQFRASFLKTLPNLPDDVDRKLMAVLNRQAIAEYYRARHHSRSARLVFADFGSFLDPFGPPNARLVQVLANVCEGHGLAREELENTDKFPLNIDIDGESVNVRFLAAALRLADLLDMDSSRACPLILRLVSPLPAGSIEHWKRHELDDLSVSPNEIRIGKICANQDEQWALYQWISWLDAEVRNTTAILARDRRTPLTPPIPSVDIRSNGSYSFPKYSFPMLIKAPSRRARQVKNTCPFCQTSLTYYQKKTQAHAKAIQCSKCRERLYSVVLNGEFVLRKRQRISEQLTCPSCSETISADIDPVPGTSRLLDCPFCKNRLSAIRGTSLIRVRLLRPRSPAVSDEGLLRSIEDAMGPQPWPKGRLKTVAERLGLSQRSVSKAVQHLIRDGRFKPQIRGRLFSPES